MRDVVAVKELSLTDVQKKFSDWRESKASGSLIPRELWDAAVSLASRISPYKVARMLRLNYSELRKHIAARKAGKEDEVPTPSFLEMAPPSSGNGQTCLVEMQNRRGDTMRIYLAADQSVDLVALGQAFWGMQS